MKTKIIIAVAMLALGFGAGYMFTRNSNTPEVATTSESHIMPDGSTMSMSNMENYTNKFEGKKGEAFDQTFVSQMILHHEEAIDMAKLALTKSKREEILSLSKSIIETQGQEIKNMKSWQAQWFGI